MNPNFKYPFWFQRGNDNGVDFWMFTFSGDEIDHENNLDVPELKMLFEKITIPGVTDSIVGIGLEYNGEGEFHFNDNTVSVSNAFHSETYDFLEMVRLFCLGYLKMVQHTDQRILDWFVKYEEYHKTYFC